MAFNPCCDKRGTKEREHYEASLAIHRKRNNAVRKKARYLISKGMGHDNVYLKTRPARRDFVAPLPST